MSHTYGTPYSKDSDLSQQTSHFNKKAAEWDSESKIKMMGELAKRTQDILQLTHHQSLDIMDFGCGTGLFGLEFAPFAKTLLGVDTSSGMLEIFDKKTSGYHHIQSRNINLEIDKIPETFDLIISSMAFHHLISPSEVLVKLKAMLNLGGRMAIVDLDKEDGSFHPDNKEMGVKHFGFSKEELMGWTQQAGLKLQYKIINTIEKNKKNYPQFLAIFEL